MERITAVSDNCYTLIKHFEGLKLSAYLCMAGKWTIGYGNTRYPNGSPVRQGDRITRKDAELLLPAIVKRKSVIVDDYTRDDLKQHEFDALTSLCWNSEAAITTSTLVKLINRGDASTDRIWDEFLKWDNAHIDGRLQEIPGLTRRRKAEAHLFLTGELKFFDR